VSPQNADLQDCIPRWLDEARHGSAEALGRLLEECRFYLLGVANRELDPQLRGKVGASDLVQETFLKAQGAFEQFHGQTEEEWLGWLRQILLHQLIDLQRQYAAAKRDMQREEPLSPGHECIDPGETPSAVAAEQERDQRLRAALAQLPDEQRQLIEWHDFERLSFVVIGQRLGKSADAACKQWGRAIEQLGKLLDQGDDPRPG
jgi:RNA polymerase sigma-70 factor (ECF subfamily)